MPLSTSNHREFTVKVPRANSAESAKTNCQVLGGRGVINYPLEAVSLWMNRVRACEGGKLINALLGRQPQNNTRHRENRIALSVAFVAAGGSRGVYRIERGSWKTSAAINNGRHWVEAQKARTANNSSHAKSKCYRVLLCRVAPMVRILYPAEWRIHHFCYF